MRETPTLAAFRPASVLPRAHVLAALDLSFSSFGPSAPPSPLLGGLSGAGKAAAGPFAGPRELRFHPAGMTMAGAAPTSSR